MDEFRGLLHGAIDIHVHSSPDCFDRIFRHDELAEHALGYGLSGIVLKCHHQGTADRVPFVKKIVPGIDIFGGLVLNHPVGGLNPAAVETAIKYGAKQIWMPSVDALNHVEHYGQAGTYGTELALSWEQGVSNTPITVLNENGHLKPEIYVILEQVLEADILLSTGHLGYEEIAVLIDEAGDMGIRKMVVDHPCHPVLDLTLEQQRLLVSKGALMNYVSCDIFWREGPVTPELFAANIRALGVQHVVISSDGGAVGYPKPYDMFLDSIKMLCEAGFSDREIRTMIIETPTRLIK